MIAVIKELAWLAVAWVGLALGLFASVWVLVLAATGEPLPLCFGPRGPLGISMNAAAAVTTSLVGSTAFVGGYAAFGARRWPVRLALLGIAAVATVLALGLGSGFGPACSSAGP